MKAINTHWITGMVLMFMLIMSLYNGYVANTELSERSEAIQHAIDLEYSYNEGHRRDPFRCSDAKLYFGELGVEVDCDRINLEVNEDAHEDWTKSD